MLQILFNMWLKGVEIIISFIPFVIGVTILHLMLFIAFDLITFSMFGDMMFAKTFFPDKIYQKIYKYLNKKGD